MSHLSVNIWNVRQTALVGQGCVFISGCEDLNQLDLNQDLNRDLNHLIFLF
jgi:uncharacterized protein (AIM24 family)